MRHRGAHSHGQRTLFPACAAAAWSLVAHFARLSVAISVFICRSESLISCAFTCQLPAFLNAVPLHKTNGCQGGSVSALQSQLIIATPRNQLEVTVIHIVVTA